VTSIGLDLLARVRGGAAVAQRQLHPTEYARCVDRVVAGERAQQPSTAPWWNPFATDNNESPRAKATLDRVRNECGLPPG
jgi:hypothetical protein